MVRAYSHYQHKFDHNLDILLLITQPNIKPQSEVNLSTLWAKLWHIIKISTVLPKITQSLQLP